MHEQLFEQLPYEVELKIFKEIHISLLSECLKFIKNNDFTNKGVFNGMINDVHLLRWPYLLNDVIYVEEKLYELLKINLFESLISNTNIPYSIYIKCLGDNYEEIVCKNIIQEKRLPKQLRNYILYSHNYIWHLRYGITAAEKNNYDYNVNYPGGKDAWAYNYVGNEYLSRLSDLSKVQWVYMEFDTIINDLKLISDMKYKFEFLKLVKSMYEINYDSTEYDYILKKYIFISNFDIDVFYKSIIL